MRPKVLLSLLAMLMLGQVAYSQAAKPMPTAPSTGNVAADEKAHIEAKTKWIQENPEEYRKMGGDPEAVLKPGKDEVGASAVFKEGAAFNSKYNYVLGKVEAVPTAGSKVSASDLALENLGLQKEFPVNTTQLQINPQGGIRVLLEGKADLRGVETRIGNRAEWSFKNESCESCSKLITLTIEKESPEGITYLMDSEDSEAAMAYRFVFKTNSSK